MHHVNIVRIMSCRSACFPGEGVCTPFLGSCRLNIGVPYLLVLDVWGCFLISTAVCCELAALQIRV